MDELVLCLVQLRCRSRRHSRSWPAVSSLPARGGGVVSVGAARWPNLSSGRRRGPLRTRDSATLGRVFCLYAPSSNRRPRMHDDSASRCRVVRIVGWSTRWSEARPRAVSSCYDYRVYRPLQSASTFGVPRSASGSVGEIAQRTAHVPIAHHEDVGGQFVTWLVPEEGIEPSRGVNPTGF
jgi:hypothetical protein